ncbi:HU family DNA-binding protein [Nocardia cyriacigeorgica]|jgi:DNA-binding protein HU-beta|uniref:DNA-binding protein HupB n=1 Tax=Nocardia cyriacigeorgica TaxID=135487 RepID=A0A2L2JSP2_9NOCA|nr:HU family DNA-binding protein [Nocardia cyriacigeorgica]AVH22844.1 HU family DNA-binding protein [Nocardia cyriacigeorgica]MBF6089530.1 HU family DNA-binding protein [Nocardia cyriacigeorgica]MBF6094509.1 HU family DNA-binding protein [Nocardia cyriacigeorgica]MBF6158757.1 HU family DNA-binding protein [Nocardia cyriacigeorgica]MBF6197557.1 HU family DNA-binding protein [Nocardia cyriacigeorgica]
MNKAELIDVLTEKLGTDRRTATAAVEHVVDTIVRAVHKGQSVTITGFGVFEQRKRAARVARNPRTGETVKVKPTSVPAFRPGAQFKAVIAGKQKLAATGPAVKRGVNAPVAAKKTAAKKTAAKKTAAKKAATKAPAKTTARKAATKAPAKTTARKTTATKTAAKKAPAAKKTTTAAKKAPAKKTTVAKKTAAKKAPAAKKTTTAAKKTTAKKTAAKKAPARRAR